MGHLALLGDSIFDNAAYVGEGPAVIDQVRAALPANWRASLLAVDGSRADDVHRQLGRLPGDVTHLALSVGGNDGLAEIGLLGEPAGSVAEALIRVAEARDRFESAYVRLIAALARLGRPAVVCTIYEPQFTDAELQRAATAALCLFNDAILRVARAAGLPVLDLRAICTAAGDFANPIEPAPAGGAKIARALSDLVLSHDFARGVAVLLPASEPPHVP